MLGQCVQLPCSYTPGACFFGHCCFCLLLRSDRRNLFAWVSTARWKPSLHGVWNQIKVVPGCKLRFASTRYSSLQTTDICPDDKTTVWTLVQPRVPLDLLYILSRSTYIWTLPVPQLPVSAARFQSDFFRSRPSSRNPNSCARLAPTSIHNRS